MSDELWPVWAIDLSEDGREVFVTSQYSEADFDRMIREYRYKVVCRGKNWIVFMSDTLRAMWIAGQDQAGGKEE